MVNCRFHHRESAMRCAVLLLLALGATAVLAASMDIFKKSPSYNKNEDLRLLHVVFRHGVRTPADTYPNDKYINHTFYPYGWGQLTNEGRLEQFRSGQFLRERYDHFLGELYSTSTVYAQSTDPDRAHMSCALTLAGLWPTKGTALDWNPELNWSPVPIRSQLLSEDTLLLARKNCPRYFEELENVFKYPDVVQLMKDNSELYKDLTAMAGMTINTPDDVQSFYNTLLAEKEYGLDLPKWTDEFYPEKLIPLTESSFIINAYNDELKRLKGGPLLKKVISDWKLKAENNLSPKSRKLFVYSGHDSTISNLLLALKVWDKQIPQYGVMILLQLHQNVKSNDFGVEIYLRNNTLEEPYLLTIPGCTPRCPLTKVIELTKNVVPVNWEEECKPHDPNYEPPAPSGP